LLSRAPRLKILLVGQHDPPAGRRRSCRAAWSSRKKPRQVHLRRDGSGRIPGLHRAIASMWRAAEGKELFTADAQRDDPFSIPAARRGSSMLLCDAALHAGLACARVPAQVRRSRNPGCHPGCAFGRTPLAREKKKKARPGIDSHVELPAPTEEEEPNARAGFAPAPGESIAKNTSPPGRSRAGPHLDRQGQRQ